MGNWAIGQLGNWAIGQLGNWAIAGIIILILAIIISNLMLLLKTANHKLPSLPKEPPKANEDEDENSRW